MDQSVAARKQCHLRNCRAILGRSTAVCHSWQLHVMQLRLSRHRVPVPPLLVVSLKLALKHLVVSTIPGGRAHQHLICWACTSAKPLAMSHRGVRFGQESSAWPAGCCARVHALCSVALIQRTPTTSHTLAHHCTFKPSPTQHRTPPALVIPTRSIATCGGDHTVKVYDLGEDGSHMLTGDFKVTRHTTQPLLCAHAQHTFDTSSSTAATSDSATAVTAATSSATTSTTAIFATLRFFRARSTSHRCLSRKSLLVASMPHFQRQPPHAARNSRAAPSCWRWRL